MRKVVIVLVLFYANVIAAQNTAVVQNPILKGFYPDPSICRVGEDYYLVNSTFSYFPGLPIFHSKDLAHWEQIGNAMDRTTQLNLDGLGISRGLFAPAIRYNNGTFYITCTLIDNGNNFVITTTDLSKGWSDPIWLPKVEGIDPSLFFDVTNRAYIIYNSDPPNKVSVYDGHRSIKIVEFDVTTNKVISSPEIIVNGGSDISQKPVWIEGPHIFKKDGFYYLIAAEGGTDVNHSEVVFRSKNVLGPYESYSQNPILTQRNLDTNRKDAITSTGHADFVEDANGNWYAVFLGSRPYEAGFYNTGRETFMAPMSWEMGWPKINLEGEVVKKNYTLKTKPSAVAKSNRDLFVDEFNGTSLDYQWMFLRTPHDKWYSLDSKKGAITLKTRPETVSGTGNPSFIGFRQQHLIGEVSTEMEFSTKKENEKSGLIVFQNESHFYYFCQSVKNNKKVVQLYKSNGEVIDEIKSATIESKDKLFLKIVANGPVYSFQYSLDNKKWNMLADQMDAKFLSTQVAGGFVGAFYAMYTTSMGEKSTNQAQFSWFKNTNTK
ncbi:glycoside hydrolase family 43 protein [Flavobacterium frigidarium]|uniref:glycoside hydrolase family 43 protein n=1 Tax=Flavobacterium frigidarium TaxID=99286 RepID=UPI0003F5FEE8|nr:glycoside hydrolase family 43 protein [Flavobacterium frigidarium]